MTDKMELTEIKSESFDKSLKETIDRIYTEPSKPEEVKEAVPVEEKKVEETKKPALPKGDRENEQSDDEKADGEEITEKENSANPDEDKTDEKSDKETEKNEIEVKIPQNMPKHLKSVLENIKDENVVKETIGFYKNVESFLQKKSRSLSKQKDLAENIHSVFEEYGKKQVDKVKFLKDYLNFDKTFEKDTGKALEFMLKQAEKKGIDVDDFIYNYQVKRDSLSPEQKKAQQEVENYKQKLSEYEKYIKEKEYQSVNKEVEDFKNATNSKGELKYPYFEDVKADMVKLIKFDKDLSLKEAYKRAVRLNDDFFEEMKKKEVEKEKEKLKLEKAKRISKQNITSRPSSTQTLSPDEMLWKAIDQCYK